MSQNIADNTPDLSNDLRGSVNRIAKISNEINLDIQQHLKNNLNLDEYSNAQTKRFKHSMALLDGSKRIYQQKPRAYYFPELPLKQFYEPEQFLWTDAVEAATDIICSELSERIENDAKFEPYMNSQEQGPSAHVNPLLDKTDWSAFFLIKDGSVVEENSEK